MTEASGKPVFISYARRSKAAEAEALAKALGDLAFFDQDDIDIGDGFPGRLTEALLDSRVVVAFVDRAYFRRWYCGKEWGLATAAFDARVRNGHTDAQAELVALVTAMPESLSRDDQARLPPNLQQQNCPAAGDVRALEALVRERLAAIAPTETVRTRLQRLGLLESATDTFGSQNALPEALNHRGPVYAPGLREPMHDRFRGRVNDMWSLHGLLAPPGHDLRAAGLTGALSGGGGFGKTCMAREYFHRYGPRFYPGGCFWVDGTARGEDLEREMHGVLVALGGDLPAFEDMDVRQRKELAADVRAALEDIPTNERILWVVDNLPEPGEVEGGMQPVETWCPCISRVTLLTTSRTRQIVGNHWSIPVDVLEEHDALSLLNEELAPPLPVDQGRGIVRWLGHHPLSLEVANRALFGGAVSRNALVQASTGGASITQVTDEVVDALRGVVPEGALRGITELFTASYEYLPEDARTVARLVAWLSPTSVPDIVLDGLARERGGAASRVALVSCSFIRQQVEGDRTRWVMHRVLADFLRARSWAYGDEQGDLFAGRSPADVERLLSNLSQILTPGACQDHRRWVDMLETESVVASLLARLPSVDTQIAGQLYDFGSSLSILGRTAGLASPTTTAITAFRAALEGRSRTRDAVAWAGIQNSLGSALRVLGQQLGDGERLKQAVVAFRAALTEFTPEHTPIEWAMTQNNLGNALCQLGELLGDRKMLEEGVEAYRAALTKHTPDRSPLNWAMTQNGLGRALQVLGEQAGDDEQLEQAVEAFRAALTKCTPERAPLDWAMTQNNLGNTLRILGQRTGDCDLLELAGEAFRAALEEFTSKGAPLNWAMTKNNLGIVLSLLGQQLDDYKRLEQAVEAFRAALTQYSPERDPLSWASTQGNLGISLRVLGEQRGDEERLEESVVALRAALTEQTPERTPVDWAMTQNNLGNVLQALGQQRASRELLRQAVEAFSAALETLGSLDQVAFAEVTRRNLAGANADLRALGKPDSD